jgi:hypothetical protein
MSVYLTNVNNFAGPADAYLMGLWSEKLILAGWHTFPGCAALTCCPGTGWKAWATDLKNFPNHLRRFRFQPPGNPGEAYIRRQLGVPEFLD